MTDKPGRAKRRKAREWTRGVYRGWLHDLVECDNHWDRPCVQVRVREVLAPRRKAAKR
jgi:hypothetical protein